MSADTPPIVEWNPKTSSNMWYVHTSRDDLQCANPREYLYFRFEKNSDKLADAVCREDGPTLKIWIKLKKSRQFSAIHSLLSDDKKCPIFRQRMDNPTIIRNELSNGGFIWPEPKPVESKSVPDPDLPVEANKTTQLTTWCFWLFADSHVDTTIRSRLENMRTGFKNCCWVGARHNGRKYISGLILSTKQRHPSWVRDIWAPCDMIVFAPPINATVSRMNIMNPDNVIDGEGPFQLGNEEFKQGRSDDLAEIYKMVKTAPDGTNMTQLIHEIDIAYPKQMMLHGPAIVSYVKRMIPPPPIRDYDVELVLWIGEPGLYKTKHALEYKGLKSWNYSANKGQIENWHGYAGEPSVVIDECKGKLNMGRLQLLGNRQPAHINVKNNDLWFVGSVLSLVDNDMPWHWEGWIRDLKQLERAGTEHEDRTVLVPFFRRVKQLFYYWVGEDNIVYRGKFQDTASVDDKVKFFETLRHYRKGDYYKLYTKDTPTNRRVVTFEKMDYPPLIMKKSAFAFDLPLDVDRLEWNGTLRSTPEVIDKFELKEPLTPAECKLLNWPSEQAKMLIHDPHAWARQINLEIHSAGGLNDLQLTTIGRKIPPKHSKVNSAPTPLIPTSRFDAVRSFHSPDV